MEEPTQTPGASTPSGSQPQHAGGGASAQISERTWAMACHLIAFTGYLTAAGFIVGPLVLWLMKREESQFIDDQGKEALNFNISLFIYAVAGLVLAISVIGLIIAVPLWLALFVGQIIFAVVAGMNANNGVAYRYPLTLRLIK